MIPLSANSFQYRILLVDDDPTIRLIGELLLTAQGYEVLCAEDGFDGLVAFKRALPDIIISDLRMPNMNGFEFLSVVRRRFPMIPVIVISGEFSGMTVPESVLADAFFPKGSYLPEELFQKILELLHELPTRPRIGKPSKVAVWVKMIKERSRSHALSAYGRLVMPQFEFGGLEKTRALVRKSMLASILRSR